MALAADRKTTVTAGAAARERRHKVGAAVKIYKGAAICRNAAGYAVPAADTLGLLFLGWAQEQVDNTSGADGAVDVLYLTGVSVKMLNDGGSAVAQANLGKRVWIKDDQTVRGTPGAGVTIGIAESIEADGQIVIYGEPGPGATVDGTAVATVSDTQTAAGIPEVYVFNIADVATADYDRVVDQKFEVTDVVVHKIGAGAANTAQVKNAATAITDAIAAAVDKAVTRAGTIDDAQSTILAGGTLRVTATKAAGSGAMKVFVFGVKRA
jgi:hypothetical protein